MKKVSLIFGLMVVATMAAFGQDGEGGATVGVIVSIISGIIILSGFGAWLVKSGFSVVAGRIENGLEKTALAMKGAAAVAESAGFEKVATWTEEFADIPDQAGDVFGKLEEMTKNNDFTAARIEELYNEGREVVVEAKDFILVVKKKD